MLVKKLTKDNLEKMLFNQVEEGLENFSKDSGTEVNTNIDMERREIFEIRIINRPCCWCVRSFVSNKT